MRKLKPWNMQNQCPNTRALQGPIYTLAKMSEYVGLANYVVYASMKKCVPTKWLFVYDCNEYYFN